MKQAVIFDLDRVVSDTQQFHAEVESRLLKCFNIFMSLQQINSRYAGVSDERMFEELFQNHSVSGASIKKILLKKWNLMREVAEGHIVPIPHAINLIGNLRKHGLKLAIASASTISFINYVIDSLKLGDMFDAFVSASEVKNGKPAPDIFLKAASKMSVKPNSCVVIEDGRMLLQGFNCRSWCGYGLKNRKRMLCSGSSFCQKII